MSRQFRTVRLKCLFSLVLLLGIGLPVLGQSSSSAAVTGIVQDTTDARIPNASVKLINTDTGTESTSTTNKDGDFSIPSVLPGHYRLQIERGGFDTTQLTGIILNVGDNKVVIIRMKVGSSQQTVTVDASGLTINTTDASVSTVIDRNFVANIPLNGRSFQDLILLTPGVVTQSPQATSGIGNGDFSVNGQRTEANYYMVDGVSGNTMPGSGGGSPGEGTGGAVGGSTALGTTQSLISVDALQEFRVESSTYSAEYGRTPGGQFSLVTRSGTESLHGSLFDYLRNNYFDANDWFNDHDDKKMTPLRQNDFGGTLGGPVFVPKVYDGRKRTFFFVSYEGLRLTQSEAATPLYVPSLSLRQTTSNGLAPILNAYPLPTGPEITVPCDGVTVPCNPGSPVGSPVPSGLAPFLQPYSVPSKIDATSVRVDQKVGERLSVFFRAGITPSSSTTRSLSTAQVNPVNTQTYTLGADFQLSRGVTNDFRLGYAHVNSSIVDALDAFSGAQPTDLATTMGVGGYPNAQSLFELYIPGVGATALYTGTSNSFGRQWNATDTTSLSFGRHIFKVGVDFRHIKSPLRPNSPSAIALYESEASVRSNQADIAETTVTIPGTPVLNEFSLFAQDEWHVIPRLNVSMGIRWEVNPPPTDAQGHDPYILSGSLAAPQTLQLAPQGTPLWHTTWFNLAPRLGVAWSARNSPEWGTVVRGGGGVFFDTGTEFSSYGYQGIGYSAFGLSFGTPLPFTPQQLAITPSITPPYTGSSIYTFSSHLQLPYTLQWNVAVEQSLGRGQALTISYVGANGRRLMDTDHFSLSALNPNFGSVYLFQNATTSNYQALQLQFQRQLKQGLQLLGSYSWSHSIDFGSTNIALPYQRGASDFDLRHSFATGVSWDLPGLRNGTPVERLFANRWSLDAHVVARTGFPISLQGNLLSDSSTGTQYYGGVNLQPGIPTHLYGSQYAGGESLNAAAFQAVTVPGENGNLPRNFFRGFGEAQINTAARKEFVLHDQLRLQFRAEAFNILNHPNFGYIDPYLTDATFGQATQMLNQSLGTVSPQYQQGGPRSMQFALRLQF